eukprot:TRINITY_DN1255_c0_g1_i4.p1 TRINITY_DN1255_c0_g1~~TRINITY_DN1255_c0_g1_i4.p1  ORF type:complete len:942 (+),score=273.64 TRINITY_DN1255_c0_g1_i4:269-2827(+)
MKGGRSFTLKMPSEESRDRWVKAINSMIEDKLQHLRGEGKTGSRHYVDDLRFKYGLALRGDTRLHFDGSSIAALPPVDNQACMSALLESATLEHLLQEISASPFSRNITRIVLKPLTVEPPQWVIYDKATSTLTIKLAWSTTTRTLKIPDPSIMLPLFDKASWQRAIEDPLKDSPQWKTATRRLQNAAGKLVPIEIEWDPGVSNTQAVHGYVTERVTGRYVDSAIRVLERLIAKQPDEVDFTSWLDGVSVVVDLQSVQEGIEPMIRMYRSVVRHDDDMQGLTKTEVSMFVKCRGGGGKDSLLCEARLNDLEKEVLKATEHIQMVNIVTSTEKLTVGIGQQTLDFVINWESFITTLSHLGTSVTARLKLAKALRDQYPGRVDSVINSLVDAEWATLCASVNKVVALFVSPSSTNRTTIQNSCIVDVCILERHERPNGSGFTSVLSFDVQDLGSYCRGVLDATQMKRLTLGSSGVFSINRTESSASSSEMSELPEAGMTVLSSAPVHEETPHPTQYAEDMDTRVSEMQLPDAIQFQLQSTKYNALYPISHNLLVSTISALNHTFSKQGTIAADDKLIIIKHAIVKLQGIFYLLDNDKKGLIQAADVPQVVAKFQEYKSSMSNTISPGLINEIVGGDEYVKFEKVAMVLLTRLLPSDVQKSLLCRRHCLLLGLDDTGKSSLVNLLKHRTLEGFEPTPTIGHHTEVVQIKGLLLSMHEIGGSASERRNWSMYSKDLDSIHGVVFMVDGGKPSSFENAKAYLKEVLHSKHLKRTPLLLIVNNAGFQTSPDPSEIASTLKIDKYCKEGKREYRTMATHILRDSTPPQAVIDDLQNQLMWLVNFQRRKADSASPPGRPT